MNRASSTQQQQQQPSISVHGNDEQIMIDPFINGSNLDINNGKS